MAKRGNLLPSVQSGFRAQSRADRVEAVKIKLAQGYFSNKKNMDGIADALFEVFYERVFE